MVPADGERRDLTVITSASRSTREDDPAWLSYSDEAYLTARMVQCFRDLGKAGHATGYARRSLDMDGRYGRGRAFNLSLLAAVCGGEPDQAAHVGPYPLAALMLRGRRQRA